MITRKNTIGVLNNLVPADGVWVLDETEQKLIKGEWFERIDPYDNSIPMATALPGGEEIQLPAPVVHVWMGLSYIYYLESDEEGYEAYREGLRAEVEAEAEAKRIVQELVWGYRQACINHYNTQVQQWFASLRENSINARRRYQESAARMRYLSKRVRRGDEEARSAAYEFMAEHQLFGKYAELSWEVYCDALKAFAVEEEE